MSGNGMLHLLTPLSASVCTNAQRILGVDMRLSTSNLISGLAAVAIATMATQASATTVAFTVNSQTPQAPAPGINSWFFSGGGSLSFASGLADLTYTDPSILTSFNMDTTWFWNVPNPIPHTIQAGTWNFGPADISSFSLTIQNGNPFAAAFTVGPKGPTNSLPALMGTTL
jgi:hypothetical protein